MKMQARLFCRTGPLSGSSFSFAEEATIGKDPGNSLQLTAGVISGKHARIYFDQKRQTFFVEDLKSRNGTWVDGVRILHKERLDRLNVISFAGSFDFIFQVMDSAEKVKESPIPQMGNVGKSSPPAGGTIVESEPIAFAGISINKVAPIPAAGPRIEQIPPPPLKVENQRGPVPGVVTQFDDQSGAPPVIPPQRGGSEKKSQSRKVYSLVLQLPKEGPQAFVLKEGENVVGRDGSCDVTVGDSSISRRHAVITIGQDSVTVRDLASKNHTFVEDKIIEAEVAIVPGLEIRFGSVKGRLQEKL